MKFPLAIQKMCKFKKPSKYCSNYARMQFAKACGDVTRYKYGTMISVSVSVKNQQNVAHVKRAVSGILVHVLAGVIKTMTSVMT